MPIEAPFRARTMAVEPAWIDYNGHLNMACYNVLSTVAQTMRSMSWAWDRIVPGNGN